MRLLLTTSPKGVSRSMDKEMRTSRTSVEAAIVKQARMEKGFASFRLFTRCVCVCVWSKLTDYVCVYDKHRFVYLSIL